VEKINDIKEIKVGQFLKVSELNSNLPVSKRLNFNGEVVANSGGYIEVLTFEFTTGLPFDTDLYEFTILKRAPSGWAKFKKTGKNPNATEPKKPKPVKTLKSKIDDLVKNNPRKRLAGLLTLAKKEIGGDETLLKAKIQLAIKQIRG
jgi:hypothetical protein